MALNKISEHMHYSTYHFSRIFTELTGMSPIRYITLRKLQYAIYDLSVGEMQEKFEDLLSKSLSTER